MLKKIVAAFAVSFFAWCLPLHAADLTMGMAFDVTSMDPHYHLVGPNVNVSMHIFDFLVTPDREKGKLIPGLAESWSVVDELTWEFKLRKGVKFHDGSEFTAEDVAYSFDRPATILNSPGPFTLYTKQIAEKIIVDKYTIRFKTAKPYALMLSDVSNVFIVSKKATAGLSSEDFNSGKGVVGTGPYKFVQWKRGDRVELARNDSYWGKRPQWDRVSLRMLTTPSARVAALLAGDVQVIEGVPPADIAQLKANPDARLFSTVSNRLIFLEVDQLRDKSPYVTDKNGKQLDKNPLKDLRVRQAISKAINRAAIVDRVMEGNAIATGQLLPEGYFGTLPGLKADIADIAAAKKLLADAGYADGFGLTIHGPSDRYVNDAKIIQTIAQMLTRIGIVTKVEALPSAVFFSRMSKQEFSVMMLGWGGGLGHVSTFVKSMLTTYNAEKGWGTGNYGRYSNPKVDAFAEQALATIDTGKQEKLWQQASQLALSEFGLIPLHHQVNVWATRKGYAYFPRTDERSLAMEVSGK
ncbi:ABC transporter substrate-binding protein [Undibacterium terreum]|uniref:Peptide ABC transporter substrate-binding protein n=1 Tax=Undibacterium terreum TaxID=1224302 RepID=A0A916UNI5_9BURK|nr:ABC transporter substrate-binding protein [Undibacterium terreum]GGC79212.1 peptide ABC transporter substrate-binding protein [Undibacterium terreum]